MSFSVREVSAMLGLSVAQIRGFAHDGFVKPEKGRRGELRFGFHDLVILRTAGELTKAKVPQRKVKRVLKRVREQLPVGRSLTAIRISAEGEEVVVRDGADIWNPESGQALFDFSVAEIVERTAPFVSRSAFQAREREDDLEADDWYDLGCELELSDVEQAQEAYEHAVELDPAHADAHVNLGRLLHEQNGPAAAEKHYRAAMQADPEHPTASFNLGVALEDLGRLSAAMDAYKQAIEVDRANSDAHYNLAGIYERRGEKAAAVRHLKECRALKGSVIRG